MVLQERPVEEAVCCHYWMIQPADGPVSLGVCQFCFETREFKNSIDDWTYDKPSGERDTVEPTLFE